MHPEQHGREPRPRIATLAHYRYRLQQHQRQPEQEQRSRHDHSSEAHGAERLALNVGDAEQEADDYLAHSWAVDTTAVDLRLSIAILRQTRGSPDTLVRERAASWFDPRQVVREFH